MVDVIIPILNEEKILTEKSEYYSALKSKARVIFVDGGSVDKTVEIASQYGEVITARRGRGIQKNAGADAAGADYLLFLHVDAEIGEDALRRIPEALGRDGTVGCFHLDIEDKRLIFRLYEWAVNMRARFFGVIDGDLGMFIRRDVFQGLGGFDALVVMEDILFSRRLAVKGKVIVLPWPISVLSRKWDENGFIKTFIQYTLAYIRLWTRQLKTVEGRPVT